MDKSTGNNRTKRRRIRVFGIVQGVGFRPFIARLARETGVAGSVCNKGPYVEIFAEGPEERVAAFAGRIREDAPERARILKQEERPEPAAGDSCFRIIESEKVRGDIFVSPDIATCPKCRRELFDPKDRRYLHPFINCTACGPRLTILDRMPYDRVRTSMGEFPMCPDCEAEYTDPATRRYHAQPVCCPSCGPRLYLLDGASGNVLARGDRPSLLAARRILREGGILAVKGIGGFHLCCDAANEKAVSRLRKMKSRPFKPFAVMMKDRGTVLRECIIQPGMEEVMEGPEKPILLLRKRPDSGRLAPSVCPDNPNVGVMLPYAPVQMLLFDYPDGLPMTDCFVMTSANPKGAPICRTDEDVLQNLSGLCDAVLSNDRKIRLRADDSVMAWRAGGPYMIRRSRGYAPLPVMLSGEGRKNPARTGAVLGMGGELKNTFCIGTEDLLYPSPYIGDLSDLRSVEALRQAVSRMEDLLEQKPERVICDLHPRYNSSLAARETGLPVTAIQHHYAHVLSCMAENDREDPVIGVSFDGTGYGPDGTVWGGEFLIADPMGYRRIGHLSCFPQAGGDLSSREGWRIAAALLDQDGAPDAGGMARELGVCSEQEFQMIRTMVRNHVNCVSSSSAGRLFDAVSALLGFRRCSTCEGEAAMVLQFRAEAWRDQHPAEAERIRRSGLQEEPGIRTDADGSFEIPAAEFFRKLGEMRRAGEDPGRLAYGFHEWMARRILEGCRQAERISGLRTAALTGGVMQNTLLTDRAEELLTESGFRVLTHRLIPPNDGGISLGQAYYGLYNGQQ